MQINTNYSNNSQGGNTPYGSIADEIAQLVAEAINRTGTKADMQDLLDDIEVSPTIQDNPLLKQNFNLFSQYMQSYFAGTRNTELDGYINGTGNALRSLLNVGTNKPISPNLQQNILLTELSGQYNMLEEIIDGDTPPQGIGPAFTTIANLFSQLSGVTTNPCLKAYFSELSQEYAGYATSNPTLYEAASFIGEFSSIKNMFDLSSQ